MITILVMLVIALSLFCFFLITRIDFLDKQIRNLKLDKRDADSQLYSKGYEAGWKKGAALYFETDEAEHKDSFNRGYEKAIKDIEDLQ